MQLHFNMQVFPGLPYSSHTDRIMNHIVRITELVHVREGVKFGINCSSCSENGSEIARECNFAVIATTSGIYPKISLLPVLSQINTI